MNSTFFISLIASFVFESTIAATFSNNFGSGILDVSDFRDLSENDSGTWYSTASDPSFGTSPSYFGYPKSEFDEIDLSANIDTDFPVEIIELPLDRKLIDFDSESEDDSLYIDEPVEIIDTSDDDHSEEDQIIIISSEGKKECKGAVKFSKLTNDDWEFWETNQANCDD